MLNETTTIDRLKPAFILTEADILDDTSIQAQKTQQIPAPNAPQPRAQ